MLAGGIFSSSGCTFFDINSMLFVGHRRLVLDPERVVGDVGALVKWTNRFSGTTASFLLEGFESEGIDDPYEVPQVAGTIENTDGNDSAFELVIPAAETILPNSCSYQSFTSVLMEDGDARLTICALAFAFCPYLKYVRLPCNLERLGGYEADVHPKLIKRFTQRSDSRAFGAFEGCESLELVEVNEPKPVFTDPITKNFSSNPTFFLRTVTAQTANGRKITFEGLHTKSSLVEQMRAMRPALGIFSVYARYLATDAYEEVTTSAILASEIDLASLTIVSA